MNASLLLTALFNGAWQGALLCASAVAIFRLFRRLNATTMFAVWSVLLAIAVLLPAANYALAPKPVTVHVAAAPAPVAPGHARVRSTPRDDRQAVPMTPAAMPTITISVSDIVAAIFRFAPQVLAVLALIALVRLALLARDVVRMLIARSRVRPIDAPVALAGDISRPFRFAASADFTSPCVLGFSPALIVLPEDLLERGDELASVVLHEREHVRRFDDIQNVVQRFIGALAFFCPGVRIALRELALYREQICDDAAVNATGDRVSYAMTLTDLAQWAQGRGVPVPSLIFKRKHLMHRLEVLLDSAVSHSLRMNRRFALGAAVALLIATAVVLRFQVPVIAFAAEQQPVLRAVRHVPQHVHVAVRHIPTIRPLVVARRGSIPHHDVVRYVRPPAPIAPRAKYEAVTQVAMVTSIAPHVEADVVGVNSPDILDALDAAGLHDLSVDDLIALRDHGVNAAMIRAASSYFGHVNAHDLTYLTDHGISPRYLDELRQNGVSGINPADAVRLTDHGVNAAMIHTAMTWFKSRPSVADLVQLADHGVDCQYIEHVMRFKPNASVADVIRLRDSGF